MRYRPERSKYERVATYSSLQGCRRDFGTAAGWRSCEKTKEGASQGTVIPNVKRPIRELKLIDEVRLCAGFPSVDSLMLSPLATDPAGLLEHQSQRQTSVSAMVAIPAAHWILQQ